ncbi:hypothetical protein ACVWYI_001714 [Bradyrhizobium sp. LB13.1]
MNVQSKPSRKVGASYWSTLTEEQLLRTAFTTNDPRELRRADRRRTCHP